MATTGPAHRTRRQAANRTQAAQAARGNGKTAKPKPQVIAVTPPKKQTRPKITRQRRTLPVVLPEHTDAMSLARAGKSKTTVYSVPKMGRPTKYKPEYCGLLVEHMSRGDPLQTFAGRVGVTIQTIDNWVHEHPDFLQAKKTGEPLMLAWWLRAGKAIMLDDPGTQLEMMDSPPFVKKRTITTTHYPANGKEERTEVEEAIEYHTPRGNTAALCYIMTNMFRHMGWRNDHRVEHSGPGGGPIKMQAVPQDALANLTVEQLEQMDEILAAFEANQQAIPVTAEEVE